MTDFLGYTKIFIALLFMVDPLAAIPTYLVSTAQDSPRERQATARTAGIAVMIVLSVFVLVGEHVLSLFSVSIDSFRVAGGVILMILALAMLRGEAGPTKQRPEEAQEAVGKESVGIIPIAIPLLAGPGAMSSMILYAHQSDGWGHRLALVAIAAGESVVVWLSLSMGEQVRRLLGNTGMNIATRIMGILIAAVAVEFLAAGVAGLLPGLATG